MPFFYYYYSYILDPFWGVITARDHPCFPSLLSWWHKDVAISVLVWMWNGLEDQREPSLASVPETQPQYVTSSTDSPRPCLVSCVGRPGLGHFIWICFAFNSVSDISNYVLDRAVRRHCYGGQRLPTLCWEWTLVISKIIYFRTNYFLILRKPGLANPLSHG